MSWRFFSVYFYLMINLFSETKSEIQDKVKLPHITTENGVVIGHQVKVNNFSYIAYLGIPYAAPPVGENRFKAPLPATPWHGVYDAKRTVQCPQAGYGEEDCLFINIFTPFPNTRQPSERPLPVLVFFHGGAFNRGTAPTTGMEHLLKHNIVVVTFNYRIGAQGFLCLGTEDAPGNAGLKDQVAALQWVQRNIINFGGHPKHVVIYGTDAGGASVELLVMSKMGDGLFKGAIVESGSATSPWSVDPNPIETATKLAETLNFIPKDIADLALFYKNKSIDDLTTATDLYENSLTDGTVGFSPCIEIYSGNPHIRQFLTESPYVTLIQEGTYKQIPMMIIYSSLEGLFLKNSQYYLEILKIVMEMNFEQFLPANLEFEKEEHKKIVANAIKTFYFGTKTVNEDTLIEILQYFGDSLVLHSILTSVEYHCKRMPVYLMEFSYRSDLKTYDPLYDDTTVAGHSALSDHCFVTSPITTKEDKKVVDTIAEIITNFVKHENPTSRLSPLLTFAWQLADQQMPYLRLDVNLVMGIKPHSRIKSFWDNVFNLYRRRLIPVMPNC